MNTSRFTLSGSVMMALLMVAFQLPTYAEITDHTGGALNGYQMVYELNMPGNENYSNSAPAYTVDNSKTLNIRPGMVESVGYYLVLDNNWAFASMNPFTSDLTKIGVPTYSSGAVFQQRVNNLYYKSNVASLKATDGVRVAQGNIEFWPSEYDTGNQINIPNANGGTFDWGDYYKGGGNYGSMQIHDFQNQTPVISYNRWGLSGNSGIGIGKNPDGAPDWTFKENAGEYQNRQLGVYVKSLNFDAVTDATQREVVLNDTQNMNIIHKQTFTSDGNNTTRTQTIDNTLNKSLSTYGMPLARQAYYYELTDKNGNKTYAYTSFDALTNKQEHLNLPTVTNNKPDFYLQGQVSNMTVSSNVAGVVNGTGIQTGNVEIWGCNYSHSNSNGIPGASDATYDFGDVMTDGNYGSFQVHNHGAQQTVFALNQFATGNPCVGIGNHPNPSTNNNGAQSDWTFANNMNENYSEVNLYVMAEAAIAPGMANVANGKDFSIVQGGRLTTQMNNNWHNDGFKYDIVDNLATMQSNNVMFDRVGYYIEYSQDGGDLQYAFVSMDAFTDDISKIGVPTVNTGIAYQQVVKNLEVTTNLNPANGTLTSGSFSQGFLEFWPSDYGAGKSDIINNGSGSQYDINDNGWNTGAGHGSMQVHNLDTGETVFAINGFKGNKQYGIGTNLNTANNARPDYTFDESRTGYKIANIYTMVRESDAILSTIDAKSGIDFYQRHNNQATVDISANLKLADGVTAVKVQAYDGTNWVDMTQNADGSYSGAVTLEGGWHNVDVRAIDGNGTVLTSTVTQKIGVGDIFITAGQSNSTNYGDTALSTKTGNVVSLNHMTGEWSIANDPTPTTINGAGDGSNRGSSWTAFGDTLSEMSGVPVGIVSVGWGGTSIGQWNPNNIDTTAEGWDKIGYTGNQLFGRLAFAIDELDGDFAGILWHQGESDAGNSEEYYEGALTDLIAASREIAGWEVPWGVALVSWRPVDGYNRENGYIDENIRNAQQNVIDEDDLVFAGPDSDALLGLFRGENGNAIHFSALGLNELGYLWATTAGKDILGLPEPSTWALMILGVAFLGGTRLMRRRGGKSVA